ncbi:MAG: MXAN_6640 family putative metalloprotease [Marmoricola sp.]
MSPAFRGVLLPAAVLTLALGLIAPVSAQASPDGAPAARRAGHSAPEFSPAEAREVLDEATRQLRRQPVPSTGRLGLEVPVTSDGELTLTLRDLFRARASLTGEDRRDADAILARPTDAGGDTVGPGTKPVSYVGASPESYCPVGGVACIHWVTTGAERIPSTADSDRNGVPDYVETVYATMAEVWRTEIGALGYRTPLPDGGSVLTPGNPDQRIDVYLADVGSRGLYGYCAPDGANPMARTQPGYCVLDNDYAAAQFRTEPIRALRVTAAHEFFHAVQFAYDAYEDIWFMEGTATWMEDQVYDSINDNYQFLRYSPIRFPRTSLDRPDGQYPYGSFLFFTFASEQLGVGTVHDFWERAVGGTASVQAVRDRVGAAAWPTFFSLFGSWNTLPAGSYSERAGYPAPVWGLRKTISKRSRSTGWQTMQIGHLGNSTMQLSPDRKLGRRTRLVVQVDGPPVSQGTVALLQRRLANGRVQHSRMALNSNGDGRAMVRFDRRTLRSLVVVVTNSNPNGSAQSFRVLAKLR